LSTKRPHLLLITTDQQRGDALGIAGNPVLSTPHLDHLAASGAYFPAAYSECPSCIPARRTIISGQTPAHQGMVGYMDGVEWECDRTLPGELGRAGYHTALVGKLHLWPKRKRYGFDQLILADDMNHDNDYTAWLRQQGYNAPYYGEAHGMASNAWTARPSHLPEAHAHTTWCVDQALRFLEHRDPTQPFFLHISFVAPHPPLTPPEFYYNRYMAMDLPEPVVGDWAPEVDGEKRGQDPNASRIKLDKAAMQRCRAGYYGLVNFIDDQVNRLLLGLRQLRLLKDTFIVFTSDHGEMLGDHNMFRKTYAYEGSARVPFIVKAPRWMGLREGVTLEQAVGLQDVMPTLLDAAGLPIPDTVDGRSVLSLLRDEHASWRDFIHGEHSACYTKEDAMQYLTDGKEKYIWYTQTGREQFFVLSNDPNECHDRINDPAFTQRVALWRQRMIHTLQDRPEGFSDGKQLITGRPHHHLLSQ